VALDLWHHTGARSYDDAVTLAAVYGRADDAWDQCPALHRRAAREL